MLTPGRPPLRDSAGSPPRWLVGIGCLLAACAVCTSSSGCIWHRTTVFPTLAPALPEQERRAFQRQDPFATHDLGPDLQARPRGYATPRAEPRRDAEARMLRGLPVDFPLSSEGPRSSSAATYRDSVRP